MNPKDLIEFVNDPQFIPGIYNYCDRWCERCAFSNRCSVYAMDDERPENPEARDLSNKQFWTKLSSIFQQTKQLIESWAKEHDVDLSAVEEDFDYGSYEKQRKDARAHPLCVAGEAYAFAVSRFFDNDFPELKTGAKPIPAGDESEDDNQTDALAVINWYQFLIAVKTMRGVLSRIREEEGEHFEDMPKDSDGSIKVALIGIDRSIAAWRLLQLSRPEFSHAIMPLLLQLERLRVDTEAEFPLAREFVRAGFDEPEMAMTIN
jgi:hypothetical protein